eukprot:2526139-Amphidinium_carterae.1
MTKGAAEVRRAVSEQVAWIKSLQQESLTPVGQRGILRIQTDRGLEFCADMFEDYCKQESIRHSVTVGYDPQSN